MLSLHTNASTLSTQNSMTSINKTLSASMTKLGTGFRVNSAMDDAAGLQIATRLNAQSRGMQVAQKNTQNGISMIQTAEGALNEINNMLLRMKDLASESANGTSSAEDRAAMQAEYDALGEEMNNILSNTSFAGSKLFAENKSIGGALGKRLGITFQVGATSKETVSFKPGAATGSLAGLMTKLTQISSKIDIAPTAAEEVTDANKAAITLALGKDATKTLANITLADVADFQGDDVAFTATKAALEVDAAAEETAKAEAATATAAAAFEAAYAGRKAAMKTAFNAASSTVNLNTAITTDASGNATGLHADLDEALFGESPEEALANAQKVVERMREEALVEVTAATKKDIGEGTANLTDIDTTDLTAELTAAKVKELGLAVISGDDLLGDLLAEAKITLTDERSKDIQNAIAKKLTQDTSLSLDTISADKLTIGNATTGDIDVAAYLGEQADSTALFNTALAALKSEKAAKEQQQLTADKQAAAEAAIKGNQLGEISGDKANATIDALTDAISAVGTFRSELGAVANRLEHTFNNLGNMVTNTEIAKGRILDVDFATESSKMVKNQMLLQTSTAMLKQSNSLSQMVGSLVQ